MNSIILPEKIDKPRRRLVGIIGAAFAAMQIGPMRSVRAHAAETGSAIGSRIAFAPLKQIDAGVLNIGYAEDGPADGKPVILLHGWPYDIHSYLDVSAALASEGHRVIVPHLRIVSHEVV